MFSAKSRIFTGRPISRTNSSPLFAIAPEVSTSWLASGDGHKIADDTLIRHGDRAAVGNLPLKQGDHTAVAAQHVAEPGTAERGPALCRCRSGQSSRKGAWWLPSHWWGSPPIRGDHDELLRRHTSPKTRTMFPGAEHVCSSPPRNSCAPSGAHACGLPRGAPPGACMYGTPYPAALRHGCWRSPLPGSALCHRPAASPAGCRTRCSRNYPKESAVWGASGRSAGSARSRWNRRRPDTSTTLSR